MNTNKMLSRKQKTILKNKFHISENFLLELFENSDIPASVFYSTGIKKKIATLNDFEKRITNIALSRKNDPAFQPILGGAW
ncbi:hypothetical protein K9M59_01210 [Candidatus Gracilibacteria bacterium]|nr:hypothetical protein [Candidatus Gracilibacteria bacterium]MCF7819186.1 hypothetical protein [Candidatus Gracilibacteria bacterium]